jgi:phosphoenolpyruvate-protein kinase (PTS system EI component)
LIGLGLRHLSMAPKDVLLIKKLVRSTTATKCEEIAHKVLAFDDDRQVSNCLRDEMNALLGEDV